jgi:hypothetical protein
LWIDDEEVYTGRYDNGFAVAELFIDLPLKEVEIRVKLSTRTISNGGFGFLA